MAGRLASTRRFVAYSQEVYAASFGRQIRPILPDRRDRSGLGAAGIVEQARLALGVVSRGCRDLASGRASSRVVIRVVLPAAYISFGVGVILALAGLPPGFDYGCCVLSRLGSRVHNPVGHRFLTIGMVAMAALLMPVSAWLARRATGCPTLSAWGRSMMGVGLGATILVGLERAFYPTHWTCYEKAHLALAGIAFSGLWLGQAMLAGASAERASPACAGDG